MVINQHNKNFNTVTNKNLITSNNNMNNYPDFGTNSLELMQNRNLKNSKNVTKIEQKDSEIYKRSVPVHESIQQQLINGI